MTKYELMTEFYIENKDQNEVWNEIENEIN